MVQSDTVINGMVIRLARGGWRSEPYKGGLRVTVYPYCYVFVHVDGEGFIQVRPPLVGGVYLVSFTAFMTVVIRYAVLHLQSFSLAEGMWMEGLSLAILVQAGVNLILMTLAAQDVRRVLTGPARNEVEVE